MFSIRRNKAHVNVAKTDSRVYAQLSDLIKLQHQARGFSFTPRQPMNSLLTGKHSSKLRGRGLNFEELRHYRSGDDIRTMDWKVTNRTRKPHVRVYTEERERNIILLIDQRVNMFFGSQHKMKSVVAAEAAALAAWRIIAEGDRVGAVIYSDDEVFGIKPSRSPANVMHILSSIVTFNQRLKVGNPSRPEQFDAALKSLSRLLSHDALIISIGDGSGWNQSSTERVRNIARHNDIIAMRIFDAAEQTLPDLDQILVSDGKMQLEIAGGKSTLHNKFSEQYSQNMGLMETELKKYGVPVIPIDTITPVQQQMLKALGFKQVSLTRRLT